MSGANNWPNLFHQNRTVSWLIDATLVEQVLDISQRQRVLHPHQTARRITSGDDLK